MAYNRQSFNRSAYNSIASSGAVSMTAAIVGASAATYGSGAASIKIFVTEAYNITDLRPMYARLMPPTGRRVTLSSTSGQPSARSSVILKT